MKFSLIIVFLILMDMAFGQDSLYYYTPAQSTIEVSVNQPFIIKLRSCNGCGYSWQLSAIDTLKIRLISVRSQPESGALARIGGDKFVFWKFIGLEAGTHEIEFVNIGPGRDKKEHGRVRFEIRVKR